MQLEIRMVDHIKKLNVLKMMIITLTLAFPFILGAYPFYVFFNPDRTQWLKDNGLNALDWNEDV